MVAGYCLFTGPKRSLLGEIVHLAGPLPQGWLNLLEEKPKAHLENDGILFFNTLLKIYWIIPSLEASLRTAAEVHQRKIFNGEKDDATPLRAEEGFHTLLGSMLKIDPESRPPPELLLQSAWFDGLRDQVWVPAFPQGPHYLWSEVRYYSSFQKPHISRVFCIGPEAT